jgi:predicted RNA-binding protein YlqC (UPF0109 family)
MKDLATFLIKNITGSDDFSLEEEREADRVTILIKANPEIIGLIIGKEGKTIKNIRRIISIRATIEKMAVNISVTEK